MSILDNTIATWTMVYGSTDIWINLAIGDLYLMFLYFWTFAYIGYFASFSNMTHHIYICLYMPVIWTMLHLYFGYMIIYGPGCWSGHQLYVHLSIILTQYNTLCFFFLKNIDFPFDDLITMSLDRKMVQSIFSSDKTCFRSCCNTDHWLGFTVNLLRLLSSSFRFPQSLWLGL